MKSFFRFLFFLILILTVLAGFLFTIRNPEPVKLWLGIDLEPRPLSVWLIGAFIMGGLAGAILAAGLWRRFRNRLIIRQLNQTISQQSLEISQLKVRLNNANPAAKD